MGLNLVNEITKSQMRTDIPEFRSGVTVRVDVRIQEGGKTRIQAFEGVVALLKCLRFVKFLQVLVLNVHSLYTHQSLKVLQYYVAVKYVVANSTTYVIAQVNQHVLKKFVNLSRIYTAFFLS